MSNTHQNRRGFTLIELMVSIAIIAVISSIGFVSYSQAQVLARDARRKSDLRSIATALEIYRQKNKHYPCPVAGKWLWSVSGGNWITDEDFANCGGTVRLDLDSNYIKTVPVDPLNNASLQPNPPLAAKSYAYGYRGYNSGLCSEKAGQFYILYTMLENTKDPESIQEKGTKNLPKDCDGSNIPWPDGTFTVTSE